MLQAAYIYASRGPSDPSIHRVSRATPHYVHSHSRPPRPPTRSITPIMHYSRPLRFPEAFQTSLSPLHTSCAVTSDLSQFLRVFHRCGRRQTHCISRAFGEHVNSEGKGGNATSYTYKAISKLKSCRWKLNVRLHQINPPEYHSLYLWKQRMVIFILLYRP